MCKVFQLRIWGTIVTLFVSENIHFFSTFLAFGFPFSILFLACLFALRFLFRLLTLRLFDYLLVLRLFRYWLVLRFCISFFNMPLSEDYPCLMVNNTNCVYRITIFLFKF